MFPVHQVWTKPSCKAQWKGEEDKADRICAHIKDPVVHVRDYGSTKTPITHYRLGSTSVAAGFPQGRQPEFPMGKIPLGQYGCKKKKKKKISASLANCTTGILNQQSPIKNKKKPKLKSTDKNKMWWHVYSVYHQFVKLFTTHTHMHAHTHTHTHTRTLSLSSRHRTKNVQLFKCS